MFAHDNISTPIPFNTDVSDDVALTEGDEAADRIISGATLVDHLKIGRALMVGARIAAKEAGTSRGKPYNIAFSRWLEQHPKLRAVNEQNRAAALWCLNEQNWPRVEKYLATLDIEERQTIMLRTVRRRLDTPPPRIAADRPAAATHSTTTATKTPPDRVQDAADQAEVQTLKKEVWRLRDKLDQLSTFLVEKPPPKAEDRPTKTRVWLPEVLERRPKDAPPQQIVDPTADVTSDPAFALRKEEFEQWLLRRKEALECRYTARESELAKSFEAKVKARVEARMAKEDASGRVYTEAQFMSIWKCLHPDSRKSASDKALGHAFRLLEAGRKRLVYAVDKNGKKQPFKPPVTPDPAPEPGGPSAGPLPDAREQA